jgi:hypothetical protein
MIFIPVKGHAKAGQRPDRVWSFARENVCHLRINETGTRRNRIGGVKGGLITLRQGRSDPALCPGR